MFDFTKMSFETAGASLAVGTPIEMHSVINGQTALETASGDIGNAGDLPIDAKHWIPLAAEKYGTSANLKDYAVAPVIIMASGLPNKNKTAFPFRRLSEFQPSLGMAAYKSWKGKPTFQEHANSDYTKAKGAVLDTGLKRIRDVRSGLWGVGALVAFDRTRDQALVEGILNRTHNSYSMGAYVTDYSCSICGTTAPNKSQPRCQCVGTDPRSYKMHACKGTPPRRVAHWNAGEFCGFEISSVRVPAFVSATADRLDWGLR